MKKTLVFGLGLALSGSAFAGFSFTNPGPINSGGAIGSTDNGILTYNYAGPSFTPGSITVEGDLTSVISGTFASEARIRITNPAGQTFSTGQWTTTTGYTTLHVGPATQGGLNPTLAGGSVGNWTFEFFESFDDGAGADSTWSNLNLAINDYVPPTPPGCTDMGNVVDTTPDYLTPDMTRTHTGGAVTWYCFTLNNAISDGLGSWLDIDTEGSNYDTEVGLYNSLGQLVATDDDDGSGTQSEITFGQIAPTRTIGTATGGNGRDGALTPGVYYLAVAGFNATFSPDFGVTTTSTNTTGVTNVNIRTNVPEPASLALLALGGLALLRRR